METFSERYRYKKPRDVIQTESMDAALRNGIWNALDINYWGMGSRKHWLNDTSNYDIYSLVFDLWIFYFKSTIDTMYKDWPSTLDYLRKYFHTCTWNEVYDLIEFVVKVYKGDETNEDFIDLCNNTFKRELSGYRFIGTQITRITSEEEISEIEEALKSKEILKPVTNHLKRALDLLSDRESPDYRNSIKESISAVEAICSLIVGKEKATLGDALKIIGGKIQLHQAFKKSLDSLYGYTSDAEGIRHALLDDPTLDFEDAKFMLVSCSTFINFLKVKALKAGLSLK